MQKRGIKLNRLTVLNELARQYMTQGDMAAAAGISRATVNAVTRGATCSLDTAEKIAAALGMQSYKELL